MERGNFMVFQKLALSIERHKELLKAMNKVAPMHALALVVYKDCGGYSNVFSQLFYNITDANVLPADYAGAKLVEESRTLLAKSDTAIVMLRNDGALTPAMERQIRSNYLHNDFFVERVKEYLHTQLKHMIKMAV